MGARSREHELTIDIQFETYADASCSCGKWSGSYAKGSDGEQLEDKVRRAWRSHRDRLVRSVRPPSSNPIRRGTR